MTFNRGNEKSEMVTDDSFPAGLRVMVVDDDPICLLILDRMLRKCSYQVTTFGRAVDALEMLRGHRDEYDLVISDVCMPDMDGFKLLELVGLEMDLPVIMMSANGETSAVMKGIKHGACDYLLKPVRIEELKNIWQHVVRKKWRSSQRCNSVDDSKARKVPNDSHPVSSENEGVDGAVKQSRKRKDIKEEEEDVDQDFDDPSGTKKSRVVWSVDLHQQFVAAVNHLGIDKAVPKRILELMNVQGLTRENIASHLQKYRLYLKRINGAVHHPGGLHASFLPSLPGPLNSSFGAASAGRFGGIGDLRTLTAAGQLPSQAVLSTLQAGLLGRLDAKVSGLGDADSILMQVAALQGVNVGASGKLPYNLAALQAQPSDVKQLVHSSHAPTFPLAGSPSNLPVLQQKQRLETAAGLECMGQLAGLSSNPQVEPHNTTLMPAVRQHQSNGCVPDSLIMHAELSKNSTMPTLRQHPSDGCAPDSLIAPTRGVQGQQGVVADEEPWVSPSSITNGAIGSSSEIHYPRSFRVGQVTSRGAAGSPSLLGSCDNMGPYISVPSVSSPLATPRINSELNIPCIQSMTGAVSEGSFHALSNLSPTFMSPVGRGQWPEPMMLHRKQAGWQGVVESHELGHSYNSLSSQKLSCASPSGLAFGHAQAQLQSPGFSAPSAGTRSAEEVMFPSTGVSSSHLKPMGLSIITNIKEEIPDGLDNLQGLPSHGLSDELLKILLKQQHETLGFTDG